MPSYTISGRVLSPNGKPVANATIEVFERASLSTDVLKTTTSTDSTGAYRATWMEAAAPATPWDIFVRATESSESVDSALISDPSEAPVRADLVLGADPYRGLSEWERVDAAVQPLLGATQVQDIGADRLEWLARRTDVHPTQLAFYIQAHRLSDGRAVKPTTCYAFLRASMPTELPGILRAGEGAWENALRNAWTRQIIAVPGSGTSAELELELTREIAAMRELVADAAVASLTTALNPSSFFSRLALSPSEQREFVELWLAHTGTLAEFWQAVADAPNLTAKVADFQYGIQGAAVVGFHPPALAALKVAGVVAIADTAAWDYAAWDSFLVAQSVTPPDDMPGADATQKRQNYARMLERSIEDAYPTRSLRHRIVADEALVDAPPNTTHLVDFFDANPSFDLLETNIDRWVADSPSAFVGTADPVVARENLEIVQRVYRLTPRLGRYETAKVLLAQGIRSAADVAAYTRDEFVTEYTPLLGSNHHEPEALAGRVWDRSARISSSAAAMVSYLGMASSGADFQPIVGIDDWGFENAGNGLEGLAGILGNLDFCACTHCRSVFSPAAYLADLLHWLGKRPAALGVLDQRRPDIQHILLDCTNTNTVLPYIDLVNELLERKFAGNLDQSSYQTSWSAEELRLRPEHRDAAVYEGTVVGLGKQITELVHPWVLPFHLPELELRQQLEHLGVPRHRLMQLLVNDGLASPLPSADEITAEALGMSAVEHSIIAGSYPDNTSGDNREFWGFAAGTATDDWVLILNGFEPNPDPNPETDTGDIRQLLRRGDYSLDELQELLSFTYVDPNHYFGTGITINWSETCNLADATISSLDSAALDRLHRFTRLQRRTQIPGRMLNVLLDDVGGGVLDETFLAKLADIRTLERRTKLAWDELASWWGTRLDARVYASGKPSLYHRRFLAAKDSTPADYQPLNDRGDSLQGEQVAGSITAQTLPTLLAAAKLSEADFNRLQPDFATNDFSFANLTAVFRAASLARAAKLGIEELVTLRALTGIDPFTSPEASISFFEALDGIRASGFSIAELDWLLRHVGTGFVDEAAVGRTLATLARGLATIEAEVAQLIDPDGSAVRSNLASVVSVVSDIVMAMDIVDNTGDHLEAERTGFVEQNFASFVDPALANAKLVTGGGTLTQLAERRNWVLRTFVGQRRKRALLIDTASAEFDIQAAVAERLLYDTLHQPGDPNALLSLTFSSNFASEAEIAAGLTPSSHLAEFAGWLRLAKAATLARKHRITAAQLKWYSAGGNGAWLDLDTLPLSDTDTAASFTAWNRLRRALDLRELFADAELRHKEIAEANTMAEALDLLAEHTGWSSSELKFIADAVNWATPAVFDDESALERLRDIARAGERLGVGLDVLWSWVHEPASLARAAEIEAVARAKYGEERWPDIAKPHRDQLRVRQRDALVAAVIATQSGATPLTRDDIFEDLLIDVEMSPCMLTTRIVQASASVQMFVHRVLLQLEAGVKFKPGAAHAWSWMKNYRVWEANRKVFLYPENWLEPELRRDKTPEFEQLEATLLQDTLDDAKVERAVAGYLAGLDRIANLEIVSVYAKDQDSRVWLLGRTQNAPRTWFLRKREDERWSPWEELPLQIDSDNVVLFERKGRLLLFWLTAMETSVSSQKYAFLTSKNHRAVELAISWSERDERGWSQTTMSQWTQPLLTLADTADSHLLRAWILTDEIRLIAYRGVPGGRFQPRAEFSYDAVSRHVALAGTSFDPDEYPNYLRPDGLLKDSGWLGLQPDYRVEGQRFAKIRLNDGVSGNDLPIAADSPSSLELAPSTLFVQGDYEAYLFHRGPSTGYRSLLHQGDLWTPDDNKRFSPVVYDDRQRKYLLEPRDGFVDASDEGNAISPDLLGSLNVYQYYDCTPKPSVQSIYPTVHRHKAQQRRDRLSFLAVWPDGIPGQTVDLDDLDGVGSPNVSMVNAHLVYGQAQDAMSGATATHKDVAPKYEYPPGLVRLRMTTLYHPFARSMVETVALDGVDALYRPAESSLLFRQASDDDPMSASALHIDDELMVTGETPREEYDFDHASAYGVYNWELFFHIPMMIAGKLGTDQRWAEAQRWYHTMFDPIETVDLPGETQASKFWRIKPFVEQAKQLGKDRFEAMLGINVTGPEQQAAIAQFEEEVEQWRNNPFDPHAIARVRPGVFQRTVLRHYFDNLIEWADHLFRQDTLESINEATILYVLVAQLLGPRPEQVPGPEATPKSYAQLVAEGIDGFSNAAQKLENWILVPLEAAEILGYGDVEPPPAWLRHKVEIRFWYFCYPPNPELLKYWDIIADRLWKIRHCRNIDGVERRLAIFQPPIDPALLVMATAAGVDLSTVLAEMNSGLPPYRFRSVIARANAFCGELRTLGSALLQAHEKRDAEALARLRSEHELTMLDAVRDIRVSQLDEARGALDSLRLSKQAIEGRLEYYEGLVEVGTNQDEEMAMELSLASGVARGASQALVALGGMLHLIPDIVNSVGTDMSVKTVFGGSYVGGSVASAGEALGIVPTALDTSAAWITTNAQYDRRGAEWQFQVDQATAELERIEKDIAVAKIRVAIAKRELANHDLQVQQSMEVDRTMREKFSNVELYDWMIRELSTLYFQTYQLAFDLAKRAEQAYRHELAIDDSALIIKYGYWDSLNKGLLAGEKLSHDLQRLELAYMDRDLREYELRKSISLARLDPAQLHALQETGSCDIVIPEILFNLDHPGHVLRRIRSVSLTIPAVTDPHTSLGARLTLVSHKLRRSAADELLPAYGGIGSIATSTATADAGLFNLDFRDERYLPFEYAGAVSTWKLELPSKVPQFDYRTIADVVMTMSYTAREGENVGGNDYRSVVELDLETKFNDYFSNGAAQLFVVHRAFPNQWAKFLNPAATDSAQVLTLPIEARHFPAFARRRGFSIKSVEFRMLFTQDITSLTDPVSTVFSVANTAVDLTLATNPSLPYALGTAAPAGLVPETWTLTRTNAALPTEVVVPQGGWLDPSKVVGMLMLVHYELATN